VADIISTDAYVICRMAGREIHRTSVISKNLSPIWTLETGSLFLIQMSPEEFFAANSGMDLVLKDYDAVGANEILGSVTVSLDELLAGTGDRKGFEIVPDRKMVKQTKRKSMLYLRFKHATKDDIDVRWACCSCCWVERFMLLTRRYLLSIFQLNK
jgi:C2 domain